MSTMSTSEYAKENVLVSADWVEERLDEFGSDDPELRLVESDKDYENGYADSHAPNAIGFNWTEDLQDSTERDLLKRDQFEEVMGSHGITEDSTVVIYGDESNQWAAYTYWQFKYYGHDDVRLMDGGRPYWTENDYPTTTDEPDFSEQEYHAEGPFDYIRIYQDEVDDSRERLPMIDVRSGEEYRGEVISKGGDKETAQRGGHIPGATNITWKENYDDEGTFKSADELAEVYESRDIDGSEEVITYCRIGERSSLTWFALHELLGYEDVRNYDGSWTEWGSMVRLPIATDEE